MKKRGPRGFDEEFRREAVRLAESGTMPIAEVARQLGVHQETLRGWRRKARLAADGAETRRQRTRCRQSRKRIAGYSVRTHGSSKSVKS